MAYGVIIRASAATAEGTHTVEILRDGYSGAVHTVHAGAPFYVEEYGTRGADLDADIRPSQVTANFVITDAAALGAVRGTLSAESREYRMVVRHGAAVMWQGYVMPVTSVTRLDDGAQGVRVVAKDRVRSLDDQTFAGAGGAPYTGQAALSTILEREIGHAGHSITQHEYAARFRPVGVSDPYAQVRIDQARFYDDETGEPTHSRGDVVRAILGTQQAQLTQWRGRWEVTTPHAAGDTFSVDRWIARSDELSGEPPARQGRASYDVGGTAVALQNGSFEAGPVGGSPAAPGWTGMARRQVPLSAVEGQYVGVRSTVVTEGPITPEQARSMASSYGYQRVPIVVGTGAFTVQVSAGGRIIQSGSGPGIRTDRHTLYLFAHIRHTGGYYYNDEAGQWQSGAHKIYLGSTFTSGLDAFWIGETIEVPTVPEGGEVEIALYSGVLATGDGWQSGWTAETWYDAVELTPASATGREVISFTSYSPTVQDGETEAIELPIGDGPFESARGAMRLASGALTSEWRVGYFETRTVPHTQILAEHLMRTRGKGRRRVRLTTTGPVSEMAPVNKLVLDSISYWPVYMSIEWPTGRATIEGIELIDVPVPSGMRESVEVRPSGPSAQAGAHRVYDYVQDQGYVTPEAGDARYLRQTGGTLTGDLVFAGGGRLRGKDDALHVYDEAGTNHGVLTVGVLRVLDHVDSYQTDILEVEDQYIKVNRGQPYPDLNGGLIVERGAVDSYLEFDEGRERWGWRLGADLTSGTFRAFVDESRSISTSNGITGGGNLSGNRQFELTGQALSLHLATGTGVFKRTSSGSIGVGLIVNDDITPNTIANNRLVNPHITLNAGTGIAAIGQIDLGGSSSITLSQRLQGVHGAANGLLVGTSNGAASRTIQGTTNQVLVSNGNGVSGNPVLSLPQDIHTGATPEFASMGIGGAPIDGYRLFVRDSVDTVVGIGSSGGGSGSATLAISGQSLDNPSRMWHIRAYGHDRTEGTYGLHFEFGTPAATHGAAHISFRTRADSDPVLHLTGGGNVILGQQASSGSHALRADRTLRIQGTANRISVSNDSALDLTSDRAWQITAPQDLHTDSDFLTKTLRTKDWAGSTSFASGWTGHGWRAEDDHLEVTDLTVRNRLRVYELLIEQIRANNGSVAISNAAEVASVSGSTITLDEGVPVPFVVNDILRAQRFTGEGVYVSMIRVTSVGSGSFGFTLLEGDAPAAGMEYVRVGNTTDEDRQGLVYLTASDSGAPFIDIIDGIDDHTKWNSSDVVRSRFGRLDGLTVPGFGQLEGYGGYLQRGYIDKEVIIGGAGLSIDSFQQRPTRLWHFDGSLVDTISGALPDGYEGAEVTDYGLVTGDGLVATLRQDGRFGGGVAVELGTTNLIPANALKFVDGWSQFQGATVTRTQLPDGRTLIETSGGTNTIKTHASVGASQDGVPYSIQVWVQNVGDVPVVVGGNLGGGIVTVSPGETVKAVAENRIGNGSTDVQLQFRAPSVSDDLKFIAWHPQIEARPFATSYTEGGRQDGALRLPGGSGETVWTAYVRMRMPNKYIEGSFTPLIHLNIGGEYDVALWHHESNYQIRLRKHTASASLDALTQLSPDFGDDLSIFVWSDGSTTRALVYNHTAEVWSSIATINEGLALGTIGIGGTGAWITNRITDHFYQTISVFPHVLSDSEIRRIALSDAPIQERPSQVRITGEQILVGTDTLIRDGFIQSKYIAANSLTTEQLSFTPLLSADGTGDIIATINATSEGLRIAGSKIEINGDVHFTSDLYDPSKKATPGDIDDAIDAYDDTLGDLSKQDLVEDAMRGEGLISGSYLRMDLIDTVSIFAQQASIGDWDIVSGNITSSGVTLNSSGYISLADNAGISGTGSGNDAVRMWAGGSYANRASAAFNVRHDGTLNATKANITGTVNATDGSFTGTINATGGEFSGYVTAGNLRLGTGVSGSNNGIRINATNYWYDTALFGIGAGSSRIMYSTQAGLAISNTHIGLSESSLRLGKEDERHITFANGESINFMDGSTSLAAISATTFRIGRTNSIHTSITTSEMRIRDGSRTIDLFKVEPNLITIGEVRPDGSSTYATISPSGLSILRGSQTLASFGTTINIRNALRVDASGNGTFEGDIYATGGTFTGVVNATEINADSGTVGGMALSPSGFFGDLLTIDQERGMVRVSGDFALGDFSPTSSGSRLTWSTSNYTALSHSVETSTSTPATYTSAWQTWDNSNLAEKQLKITYAADSVNSGSYAVLDVQMRSGSTVVSEDTLGASIGGTTTIPIPAGVTDIRFRTRLRAEAYIDDVRVPPRVVPGSAWVNVTQIVADSNQPFVGPRGALWRHPLTGNPMATINALAGRMYANNGLYWTDNGWGGIATVGGELGRDVYTIRIDENDGTLVVLRYTASGATQRRFVQMQGSGWTTV